MISYTLGIILTGFLAQRLFSWFKSNRNLVVILYGLSSAMFAANAVFSILFVTSIFPQMYTNVPPHLQTSFPIVDPNSTTGLLNNVYTISSIISFIIFWIATAILLSHYSRKLGKFKYWLVVSAPLVYFLSQFVNSFMNVFTSLFSSNPLLFNLLFTLIFTLSKPVGGILVGTSFWAVAKNVPHGNRVRYYLVICEYGFVLLFISNQAIVLVAVPYPPFGLATVSFLGLSSYLVLIGLYYSAISVSQDTHLRKSIRTIALKETKLLDSIGTAQMQLEIESRVLKVAKEQEETLKEQTGVQPSLDEDDIKEYLDQIINQVKKEQQERKRV
jgi:hypothetical protein